MSQMGVSEMVDDDDDDNLSIILWKCWHFLEKRLQLTFLMLVVVRMTVNDFLSHKNEIFRKYFIIKTFVCTQTWEKSHFKVRLN